jgi:hypothetical protein
MELEDQNGCLDGLLRLFFGMALVVALLIALL